MELKFILEGADLLPPTSVVLVRIHENQRCQRRLKATLFPTVFVFCPRQTTVFFSEDLSRPAILISPSDNLFSAMV
jgi:hypothetical protein